MAGSLSAAATLAAREAPPESEARPSARASTVFRRPARVAGIAANSATAATISASAASSVSGWKALGVAVARRLDIGSRSSGAIAVPATRPSRPAAAASATYSATSSPTTPAGVIPIAFRRPISRRCASTRPLITVATVKPTAISASSVLTPMMIVFVRAWSVIVSRTSCQSLKRRPGCFWRAARLKASVASGSLRRTAARVVAPVTVVVQTRPGRQRGKLACCVVTAKPVMRRPASVSPTRRRDSRGEAALHERLGRGRRGGAPRSRAGRRPARSERGAFRARVSCPRR